MISGPMASTHLQCAVCADNEVALLSNFSKLPRVSSDCRPFPSGGRLGICLRCGAVQKPADSAWIAETSKIYAHYDMFRQAADRAEQAVFDEKSGMQIRRSAVILNRLHEARPLPPEGRALDVGCGNGPTLRALSALVPAWDLFGHEISDTNSSALKAIPGFRDLYTGEIADIAERFDLIILSQSLEHVLDPVRTLDILKTRLTPDGILLVQVPNARLNVFDLVVADHRSHFDPVTLADAARRAGFPHIVVAEWVYKELSMTVSNAPLKFESMPFPARMTLDGLVRRVDWLVGVIQTARDVAEGVRSFGVFGSSIAATWLCGALQDHINFFVDEDTARIGQFHEGKPILAPSQVPVGATVFVPLVPLMAQGIAARLNMLGIDARVPALQSDC